MGVRSFQETNQASESEARWPVAIQLNPTNLLAGVASRFAGVTGAARLLVEEASERVGLLRTRIANVASWLTRRSRFLTDRFAGVALVVLGEKLAQNSRMRVASIDANVGVAAGVARVTIAGHDPRSAGNDGKRGEQNQTLHETSP